MTNTTKTPNENNKIIILGSTGSIGLQALDVASNLGIEVEAIAANKSWEMLTEQIKKYKPKFCAVRNNEAADRLREAVSRETTIILSGPDCEDELISNCTAPVVLNAVIGFAGLSVTLSAIKNGKDVALANKESLVAAGDIVMESARKANVKIIPVDSEHCAIEQCLIAGGHAEKLILTASGGPFFGLKRNMLEKKTVYETLAHPTWKMGKKITVDSATLMNKGFEVIEAVHLFSMPADSVDVVVHRESIIHSMVEYNDNTVIAQLSVPDMRTCIAYAITRPLRSFTMTQKLDLTKIGSLTFYKPDTETFSLLKLAYEAARRGGVIPAVLNAANEAAVDLFLESKINLTDIFDSVEYVTLGYNNVKNPSLEDIHDADSEARRMIYSYWTGLGDARLFHEKA